MNKRPNGESNVFAKIFNQIYDSSIVENPETRFTFMDFLILADINGVVDMTHEAIARRTNRPIEIVRKTILELEGADPYSRTRDAGGARIYRLDDHRDWGWGIVNYNYYRALASQEQRREKTKLRTQKWRKKLQESSSERHEASQGVTCDASPSASTSSSSSSFGKEEVLKGKPRNQKEVEEFCVLKGLPRSDGEYFWNHWVANGFKNSGKVMLSWQATIISWKVAKHCPSQKPTSKNARPTAMSELDKRLARDPDSPWYQERT
jgi:hypothetical protein